MVRSRCMLLFISCLLICTLSGCDMQNQGSEGESPAPQPPSPWHNGAVHAPDDDRALAAAIATARETAQEARAQWMKTPPSLRTRWAVKWAAPTAAEGVEYLWVQPLHWSPFRIEGLLASEPVGDLASGERQGSENGWPRLGDLVAFPIEELADWVHYVEGDTAGPREGGFTIDVLEERFGRPSVPSRE